jgi:hypothetical protein
MLKLISILVFILSISLSVAQERHLDEEKWAEISERLDYSEKAKDEPVTEEQEEPYEYRQKPDLLPKLNMAPIRVLAILFVVVLLVVLIIYLLDKDIFKKMKPKSRLKVNIDDPDYLDLSDLERALREEVDQANFKACIRIHYLLLLEKLDSLRIIYWKKAKTNRQYILEIRKNEIQKDLRKLTRVYEDVWFGDFTIDQERYEIWAEEFKTVINSQKQ